MRKLLLLLVACLLVLTGCSGIPERSDPVVVGPAPAPGDEADQGNGIQPGGPDRDASSDAIVRGFIKALTATDTTYAVAREFLTPEVAKSWTPSEEVTIIEPSNVANPGVEEGSVQFAATRVAKVDVRGVYHVDSGAIDYDFELVQVAGQWRITNPPAELIIDRTSFGSLYKDASIYFADPSGGRLVPDVRYFRTNPQQRANRLIQALIDGPVGTLTDGVRNELGGAAKLRSAVNHRQDPITIDLSGLGQKTEAQLRVASAQIMWTLQDLGVQTARITNDGEPLDIAGVGETQEISDWADFDPNHLPFNATAYYIDGGAVLTDTAEKVPGPAGTGEYSITEAAVSINGTRIAAVSAGSTPPVLRTGAINEQLSVIDLPGTTSLSAPTWGPSSEEFWIVRNGSEIMRVSAKGAPKIVSTQGLTDVGQIRRIALSRDGVRLAVLAGQPGGPGRLYLATVQSSADSVSLLQPVPLAANLDVSAVVWRDARTLAVLGRPTTPGSVLPFTLLIDNSSLSVLPAPVLSGETLAIAAAPDRPFLCSINQNILRLQDSAWVSLVGGIAVTGSRPFYPG